MTTTTPKHPLTGRQWPFWAFIVSFLCFFLYWCSPILMPFVAGMAIAYFMDPVVDRMELRKIPRWAGATLSLVLFTLVIVMIVLLVLPMVKAQTEALLTAMPGYVDEVRTSVLPWAEKYLRSIDPKAVDKLRDAAASSAGDGISFIGNIVGNILSSGLAVFDVLSLLVVTPIVAFYFLRDWDNIVAVINGLLPRKYAKTIHNEAAKVDETLSGFLHGQALVCLALGVYYAFALTLVGLNFGATIGVIVGVLSFIPYVGSIFGFVCSTGLALIQFDTPTPVIVVIAIYLLGQALEGNVISPKLVGDRIGLHPVWIIFAIMAGGALFGFIGVLVALPVAAILGVLIRFAIDLYKHSRFYLG